MAETIRLTTPLTEEKSRTLRAGDSVLITGTIYSARDAAVSGGRTLPESCRGQ